MPDLSLEQLNTALAVLAGVAIVALGLALFLAFRVSRLKRLYVLMRGDGEPTDIFGVVGRSLRQLETFDKRLLDLAATQEQLSRTGRLALQRFGIARYDAFDDMGGRLSFSAALLDDHGDGLMITSINGRTETRTYAKPIRQMKSQHNLSQEENAAIAAAMSGQGRFTEARIAASR